MDLVQIRWQQIRLAEASQVVSRENIELKNKIAQLQVANSSKNTPKNDLDPELLRKLKMFCKAFTAGASDDLSYLRRVIKEESVLVPDYKAQITLALTRYVDIIRLKDEELNDKYREQRMLQKQVLELQQNLNERDTLHRGEFSTFEIKISRLQDEIKALKEEKSQLNSDVQSQKEANSRSKGIIQSLQIRVQELEQEILSGKGALGRLQELSDAAIAEQMEQRRLETLNYEKMIEEMGLENQYLRTAVAELEDQIARLSNAVVGNKSHFAKYVEVKTENLALQNKLESIKQQQQQRKSSGLGYDGVDIINSTLPALQQAQRPVRRNTSGEKNNNLSSKQPQLGAPSSLASFQEVSRKQNAVSGTIPNANQPPLDSKLQLMNRIIYSSSPRNSMVLSQQHQDHLQPEPPLSARSKEEQVYSSALTMSRSSVAVSVTNDRSNRNSHKMVV